jgi:hypothetical protein
MTDKTKNTDVRAVIELKDALTDLDKAQNRLGINVPRLNKLSLIPLKQVDTVNG